MSGTKVYDEQIENQATKGVVRSFVSRSVISKFWYLAIHRFNTVMFLFV